MTFEIRRGALGLGANFAVQLLDISEGGVRAIVKSELAEKQEVEVLLSGYGVNKATKRMGVVSWSIKLDSGEFAVGVRFDKHLSYRDVSALSKP